MLNKDGVVEKDKNKANSIHAANLFLLEHLSSEYMQKNIIYKNTKFSEFHNFPIFRYIFF